MAWEYSQTSGRLSHNGQVVGYGYSGSSSGRNNASLQCVRDVGPIPRGSYRIGRPRNSISTGPHVMDLDPFGHNACGRSGFQIHGDNSTNNASTGCIILSRPIREQISTSGDDTLSVVQ